MTRKAIPQGARVSVAGVIGTENGERQITASDVFVASTGNTLPDPLGMVGASVRADFRIYLRVPDPQGTVGSSFKAGLDSTGLLVRVWGTITGAAPDSSFFYLDDGSSRNDGSGYVGIRVYGTPPSDLVGKRVSVTGISSAELAGETPVPVIRTRMAEDVTEVTLSPG